MKVFARFAIIAVIVGLGFGCDMSSNVTDQVHGRTPAFPGAEGHGRYATGGRGGIVYWVTNLYDYAANEEPIPGSLRYGVERAGVYNRQRVTPVTILFNVDGTIMLRRDLRISHGNLTIAGQSAPGEGIAIGGFSVVLNNPLDNVIIRFMRFRMSDLYVTSPDGADAIWGRRNSNIIIDHCSMSWSTDEVASFYGNENFTLQWSIISESLNYSTHSSGRHGFGGIWGGRRASFLNNLMAHHNSRTPRLGPDRDSTTENELTDLRNNVFFNYDGAGAHGGEGMNVNIVNNFFDPGPANRFGPNHYRRGRIMGISRFTDNRIPAINYKWGTFYVSGNVVAGHAAATADNWTYGVLNQFSAGAITQDEMDALRLYASLDTGFVTTRTAERARELVLSFAGASLHRDSVDQRIVQEAWTGTTTFRGSRTGMSGIIDSVYDLRPANAEPDWSPWPILAPGEPWIDSNGDGIPDGWLETHFPGRTSNCLNAEGFTFLEVWLNSIVEPIISARSR